MLFAATLAAVDELAGALEPPITVPTIAAASVLNPQPLQQAAVPLTAAAPMLFASTSQAAAAMLRTPEPWGANVHLASMQLQVLASTKAVQDAHAEGPALQGPMAGLLTILQEV